MHRRPAKDLPFPFASGLRRIRAPDTANPDNMHTAAAALHVSLPCVSESACDNLLPRRLALVG